MMMEQCQKKRETSPGTLAGNDDGTGFQKTREARNPSRNQEMMMEQSARRVGRQVLELQPEPGNDDGTGCQKSRKTSPGTQPEPRNDDGTECQKSRETSPGTPAGTRK